MFALSSDKSPPLFTAEGQEAGPFIKKKIVGKWSRQFSKTNPHLKNPNTILAERNHQLCITSVVHNIFCTMRVPDFPSSMLTKFYFQKI